MVPIRSSGKTRRRPRRKLKGVIRLLYAFAVFVAVAMAFSYRKIIINLHGQLESDTTAPGSAKANNPNFGTDPVVAAATSTAAAAAVTVTTRTTGLGQQQRGSSSQQFSTCAILLFGLPRAFRDFVLPSLEKNVILPNAKYGCDYFVHYYQQDSEASGRSGRGGAIRSEDIFLLEVSVRKIHEANTNNNNTTANGIATPNVAFVSDTNETFWNKREAVIQHYRTAKNPDGNYAFFPYGEPTYEYPGTLDNIVKQWHSVNAVWDAMEEASSRNGSSSSSSNNNHNNNDNNNNKHHQYRRVAMMRNDVIYLTPIDIYGVPTADASETKAAKQQPQPRDDYSTNIASVIPNFAKYPVNDRLIYGPYSAVSLWASHRFSKIEEYAKGPLATPGMVMHSETFLNASILQAIKDTAIDINASKNNNNANRKTNLEVLEDKWICFLRVRADGAIWIEDCDASKSGFGGGYPGGIKAYSKLLQEFLPNHGKGCKKRRLRDKVRRILELACPKSARATT